MVSLRKEQERIQWVRDEVRHLSKHDFLERHVNQINCDEDKTALLIHAIQSPELTEKNQLDRVTSALLVDAALITHQFVPLHNKHSDDEERNQLIVLAGDLYSSLYYDRLSDMADIPLIRVFSSSIQVMNDAKIRLHERDWSTPNELEELVKAMESTLISNVAAHYGAKDIQRIAPSFLTVRRLRSNVEAIRSGKAGWGAASLSPMLATKPEHGQAEEEKQALLASFETVIDHSAAQLHEAFLEGSRTLSPFLTDRIKTILKDIATGK